MWRAEMKTMFFGIAAFVSLGLAYVVAVGLLQR